MPKATKGAQHEQHTIENIVLSEETSSDQEHEIDQVVTFNPPQPISSMFMPYIKDSKMD